MGRTKNWGEARFHEQPESDTVMDDVEALFGVNREQLGFIPEEKGGEIAGKLFISEETVKVHIKHIMEKLGASDRTQAVAIGIRRGIIQL